MDRKILIKKLKSLFCDINKTGERYSEVWISEVIFGGVYKSGQYKLYVRAEHKICCHFEEVKEIIILLKEKAPDASPFIWSVHLYNADDRLHSIEDGIPVYEKEEAL
jgi:hypothetical protein